MMPEGTSKRSRSLSTSEGEGLVEGQRGAGGEVGTALVGFMMHEAYL